MRSSFFVTGASARSWFRSRWPSLGAALLIGTVFLALAAPAEKGEEGLELARELGWRAGAPAPCASLVRGRFHSFTSASAWGEFYFSLAGEFFYPANQAPQSENSPELSCGTVPSPSRVEQF